MRRISVCALCAPLVLLLLATFLLLRAPALQAQSAPDPALPNGPSTASIESGAGATTTLRIWSPMVSVRTALAGGLNVSPTLDAARAVTRTLPPGGGVIEATNAAGDRFVLTLPNGALLVTTTITLTPVSALAGAPVGSLAAGVQIAPDLQALWQPATLRIVPHNAIPVASQNSFAWFGGGKDFHLYPLTLDPATITFSITRLHGYGLSVQSAVASAEAAQAAPDWSPLDILANIAQRMQGIIRQMREDALAERPSDPALEAQMDALLREMWQNAIQPLLQPIATDCDAAHAYTSVALGWMRQVELLGRGGDFAAEFGQVMAAVVAGLENCIEEAAQPCFVWEDVAQVEEILGYMRQLALLGSESDLNLDELPQCQKIAVALNGALYNTFAMQPDAETAWEAKAYFDFTDDAVSGVLLVNPFGMFASGATGKVEMLARFGDEWRLLPHTTQHWYCRDRAAERIDGLLVKISNVGGAAPPVPMELIANKLGCWSWSVQQSYADNYTAHPDIAWTRSWDIDTTLVVTGMQPFVSWDTFNNTLRIGPNQLRFQLAGSGAFHYAENYVYTPEDGGCSSSLLTNKTPPMDHGTQYRQVFLLNIDPIGSPNEFGRMGGGVEVAINEPYEGSCGAFQDPKQFQVVPVAPRDPITSGKSSSGADSGSLPEQSGTWTRTWTYTAQRQ